MDWNILYLGTGVLLFALATAILYIIGIKKKMTQEKRLIDMLLNNGARRVISYLKEHDTITADGIGHLMKEVKAKEFMSSTKAVIQDGRAFQKQVIEFMTQRNYIEICGYDKGKKLFRLVGTEDKKEKN